MNPIDNLAPECCEEVYGADVLLTKGFIPNMGFAARPLGTSVMASGLWMFTRLELTQIFSILGILVSTLSIILIFLAIRHFSKNDVAAVLGSLLYVLMPITVYFSASHVETTLWSSFFALLLMLLYSADSGCGQRSGCFEAIVFCTSLLVFFRIENLVFLLILIIYIAVHRKRIGWNKAWWTLVLAFIFVLLNSTIITSVRLEWCGILPNIALVNGESMMEQSFGLSGWSGEFLNSYISRIYSSFYLLSLFLVFGIFSLLFRKKEYFPIGVLFCLMGVYLLHKTFSILGLTYFFAMVPMMTVCIGCGLGWALGRIGNAGRGWKAAGIAVLALIVIASARPALFSRTEQSFKLIPLVNESLLDRERTILYGPPDIMYCLHRFYNYTVPFDSAENVSGYEYLIYVHWDLLSTDNETVKSTSELVERETGLDVELIEPTRREYLYRIKGSISDGSETE